jgi:hypothetical protein
MCAHTKDKSLILSFILNSARALDVPCCFMGITLGIALGIELGIALGIALGIEL